MKIMLSTNLLRFCCAALALAAGVPAQAWDGAVAGKVAEYALPNLDDAQPRYRLLTTLLDARAAPALELAALYHQRWHIALARARLVGRNEYLESGMRLKAGITIALLACTVFGPAVQAAQGEMGTGVPHFGLFSSATGTQTVVWSLANATTAFPAGCERISLNPQTMGLDAYKMAVAVMTVAKVSNRSVRFYAHAERDGGCGVDYVQMN